MIRKSTVVTILRARTKGNFRIAGRQNDIRNLDIQDRETSLLINQLGRSVCVI
jgi:hypothetical protein